MSGANFQIDFIALGLDEKLEKIELEEIENEVDHIRDLLVFDDDTNETIGLVSGGRVALRSRGSQNAFLLCRLL